MSERNKDMFSDLTNVLNTGNYDGVHQQALRKERAEAIDKRITEFDKRVHDLVWAQEAESFCASEEENAKDIVSLCNNLDKLASIRGEAKLILKAEDERLRKKQEELDFIKAQNQLEIDKIQKELEVQKAQEEYELLKQQQELELQKQQEELDHLKQQQALELQKIHDEIELKKKEEEMRLIQQQKELEIENQKEKLRIRQEELRLEHKKQQENLAREFDNRIEAFDNRERDLKWVKEVRKLDLEMKTASDEVLNNVKNRLVFDAYLDEADLIEKAYELDSEIIKLSVSRSKNKVWARNVFDLEKHLDKVEKYLSEKNTYYSLLKPATKIYYSERLEKIEKFIVNTEKDIISDEDKISLYNDVKVEVGTLSNEIYVPDYIEDFDKRWNVASEKLEAFIALDKKNKKAIADELEAQKQADAAAKREQRRKSDEIKRKAQEKRRKRERRLEIVKDAFSAFGSFMKVVGKIALVLGILALAVVPIVFGVLNFDKIWGQYLLSGGIALFAIMANFKISCWCKDSDTLHYLFTNIIKGLSSVMAIVGMIVPMLNAFAIPMLLANIITSILHAIMSDRKNGYGYTDVDCPMGYIWANISFIVLIIACAIVLPATANLIGLIVSGVLALAVDITFYVLIRNYIDTDEFMYALILFVVLQVFATIGALAIVL